MKILSHYVQMLTNVSVLYAYLVNGLLTMASIVGMTGIVGTSCITTPFATHFFQRHFFSLN
jgi:hypothetical protein